VGGAFVACPCDGRRGSGLSDEVSRLNSCDGNHATAEKRHGTATAICDGHRDWTKGAAWDSGGRPK
jgi:hypothetical protein